MKRLFKFIFSLLFFRSSWWNTLFLGISIGIAMQRIPELREYTSQFAEYLEKPIEQILSLNYLQHPVIKKILKK